MATRTSYLNLIKPDYTDAADIADINDNMDTLDTTIQGLDETGSKSLTAHNSATDAHSEMQATVDDTLVPTADLNNIRNLLSNLGNRIKAATGASGWKGDPATTLASLATLASNLASGSDVTWDGKKFTNTKLGISGLMDANGYVSFGPNFGGLIIQWILDAQENKTLLTPLSCKNKWFEIAIHKTGGTNYTQIAMKAADPDGLCIITPLSGESTSYWFGIFTN